MINLKNLKNLKQGFKQLTPSQFSEARMACYIGMTVGGSLATYALFVSKTWGLGIFMTFVTLLQLISFLGEKQKYQGLLEIQKQLNVDQDITQIMEEDKNAK